MKNNLKFITLLFILLETIAISAIGQNLTIPDANFKAYLLGNSAININGDNEIQLSEAVEYTGNIICPNLSIDTLEGIQNFINIKQLNCKNNNLTALNLTQNTQLEVLTAQGNQISNLSLNTINSQLWFIDLGLNQLTSFNPSNHPLLKILTIFSNQITTLDVSQNALLENLRCDNNFLTSLNLSNNPLLYTLLCNNNQLTSLSLTQNPALINLDCFNNLISNLNVTQNTLLEKLRCFNNQLVNLNVIQNINLTNLVCNTNLLTSLNVSQNILLEELRCGINNITTLDLTQNSNLTEFVCAGNNLSFLNIKNTNNQNITVFNAIGNPNLPCIIVDNAAYSAVNWNNIDPGTLFAESQDTCNLLSIENNDNIFELVVFPNPTNTYFEIYYNEPIDLITLTNIWGQTVLQSKNKLIQTENLNSGIYFLKIFSLGKTQIKKIIIN